MIGHMKDRGSLIQLLDAFGAEPSDKPWPDGHTYYVDEQENRTVITLGHGRGYRSFYCDFVFDKNGNFVEWAVYE